MIGPAFRLFFKSFLEVFSLRYLPYHLLAIFLTAICVFSGFDWWYLNYFRGTITYTILFFAVPIGGIIPFLLPLGIWMFATLKKSSKALNTVYALIHASLLGSLVSSLYKTFTGRLPPVHFHQEVLGDVSHMFQFGFLRGGIFWGWPSSHTTIAFATAVTLFLLLKQFGNFRYLFLGYALYVGLGVSMSIHWFSDFAAGMIIGSVIGAVVAKKYRDRYTQLAIAQAREAHL